MIKTCQGSRPPISEYDADTLPLGHCPKHGTFYAIVTHWCPQCPPRSGPIIKHFYMIVRPCSLPMGYILDEVDVVETPREAFGSLMSCEGQTLSIDSFPDLYKVMGNSYGGSFEARTFKMPDLRNKTVAAVKMGNKVRKI